MKFIISYVIFIVSIFYYGNAMGNDLFFKGRIDDLVRNGYISNEDRYLLKSRVGVNEADFSGLDPDMSFAAEIFGSEFIEGLNDGARKNEPRLMYYLGIDYLSKENGCVKGVDLLKEAAKKNLIKAHVRIGVLIERGVCGYKSSAAEAIKKYEIGLIALEPESMHRLSLLARVGSYKDRFGTSAGELNKAAAFYGLPIAQYLRGVNYFSRKSVDRSVDFAWLLIAYVQGMDDAMHELKKNQRKK